jgi:hypothetical protein
MRTVKLVIAGVLMTSVGIPILAAQAATRAPTYARCEALSIQRGSGPGPGGAATDPGTDRSHRQFIADCLAGKVPGLVSARPIATPDPSNPRNFDYCEALSIERGSGPGAGGAAEDPGVNRAHRSFVAQCMAGKIH